MNAQNDPPASPDLPSPKPRGSVKSFACGNCGGIVNIRAGGHTVTAVCNSCGSLIDALDENYRILKSYQEKMPPLLIELGTRGRLKGVEWEVIGNLRRTDGSGMYSWQEFLLFNPYHGFRWLVEQNGAWSFVTPLKEYPDLDGLAVRSFSYYGKKYEIFDRGEAVVRSVVGEFYWRVKRGESVQTEDYISPPHMFSIERDTSEINVSLGEYVPPQVIWSAFKLPLPQRAQRDIAPHQPSPYRERRGKMFGIASIFLTLLVVIHVFTLFSSANQVALEQTIALSGGKSQVVVSPPFRLEKSVANVELISRAMLTNQWAETDFTLINEDTGKIYNFVQGIEYYEGRDSDGAWSEGSRSTSSTLSAIPGGRYRLTAETESNASVVPVQVTLKRDVPIWSNFFLACGAVLLWFGWEWLRDRSFETRRWSNSDFSPYSSGEDDD
ncbi:MAG: DUF4178 domain-containing protein [Alphaproteobacteria bacterium]|nr:DUF4178 domain-containing protein [Alphaproteobacteria bacterium]